MEKKLIPVKDNEGVCRDVKTDAIIFINNKDEKERKQKLRAARKRERREIQDLKNEVSEIKDLLRQLLEKR